MTTIVYHDGIIAYDSQSTAGNIIVETDCEKKEVFRGVAFVFCGPIGDQSEVVSAYFGEGYNRKADASAIIADKGRVYVAAIEDDEGFFKFEITDSDFYCIGSGERYAWTAFDCGCTAKEAVAMAIKRDVYTGGKIRTHKVKR